MRWLGLGLLVAMTLGSPVASAQSGAPVVVDVELVDANTTLWLATSAGLFSVPTQGLDATSGPADWTLESVDGRSGQPIDDTEPIWWPGGETLTVASEGVLWGRAPDGSWVELGCDDTACPGAVDRITTTFDPAMADESDLVAFGPDGIWVLERDRTAEPAAPTTMQGWTWVELDAGIAVLAVAQDVLGRLWAITTTDRGLELRVYLTADRPLDTSLRALRRPLPRGWEATESRQANMTPDTRGGMWIGLPRGVLWMNLDLAVRDDLDTCELGIAEEPCEPADQGLTVMSVDNARDDVWVGTSQGLVRLSVGEKGKLDVSSPRAGGRVASTARNIAGGDVWVATNDQLERVGVDRWSNDPTFNDPITAIAVQDGNETVVIGTLTGAWRATWRPDQASLDYERIDGVEGLVTSIAVTADGAFVATESGLVFVPRIAAPEIGEPISLVDDTRVAVVELVGDRVLVGTANGARSASMEAATRGPADFVDVSLGTRRPDVTEIWEAGGRVWIGTADTDVIGLDSELTPTDIATCGDEPPSDAVVRSAAATGGSSFAMVTSDGIYGAYPPGPDSTEEPECDLAFERIGSADSNTVIAAGEFVTVADGAADRDRLVWAGTDRGLDLIAWTGAFADVDQPVTGLFESEVYLDSSRVSALATVGSGLETTVVLGTDNGVYYHRPAGGPAAIPADFEIEAIAPLSDTGAPTGRELDCLVDVCAGHRFGHETSELVVELQVSDLGDADRFQFIVDDGSSLVTGREFDVETGRGQTVSLEITALDLHLNRSESKDLQVSVKSRTLAEWFWETPAKWIALVIAVALTSGVGGVVVVRRLRRLGRHSLTDVELLVRPQPAGTTIVATAGAETDTSVRLIDRSRAAELWKRLAIEKTAQLVPEIGDVLYDGLLSRSAEEILVDAGLGSRDVRLRLRGLDAELDALPWETLRTPSGRLVSRARTTVLRDLRSPDQPETSRLPAVDEIEFPVRVLVVVATPTDRPDVAGASDEIDAIRAAAAERYRGRARGEVEILAHARPETLRAELQAGYDFVHVIAHGDRTGRGSRIWLEDEDGDAVRVEHDELVDLFAGQERDVRRTRLVVLNTCLSAGGSGEAASSLAVELVRRANLPAVIGMSMKVRTPAAVAFSSAFYRTLFRHGQVDHAMLVGRREVAESDADWVAPRLYVGAPEPELFGVV